MKARLSEAVTAGVEESSAGIEDIRGEVGVWMENLWCRGEVKTHRPAQTVCSRCLDERQAVGRLYLTSCSSSLSLTT